MGVAVPVRGLASGARLPGGNRARREDARAVAHNGTGGAPVRGASREERIMAVDDDPMPVEGGFPRPDWEAIDRLIEARPEPERDGLWRDWSLRWVEATGSSLSPGYAVSQSENFLLLSARGERHASLLLGFLERARGRILSTLDGIASDEGYGKNVVLVFDDWDDYYRYLSYCTPDEGEFPLSGGGRGQRAELRARPALRRSPGRRARRVRRVRERRPPRRRWRGGRAGGLRREPRRSGGTASRARGLRAAARRVDRPLILSPHSPDGPARAVSASIAPRQRAPSVRARPVGASGSGTGSPRQGLTVPSVKIDCMLATPGSRASVSRWIRS